ncbi:hypothetical protein [Rhizobium leguminosarum]|uniref:hypothetical protein n=1 Tax=Rhizobium leguminosarum TaxID=384 RepID=UPI001C94ADB5|nr:hypothetical protein [Rhizobium leguminosarum]MBY5736414.1 hypothetical protein [Rhizobium leguminosarum]
MARNDRGTIVNISIEIEYPDGSKKSAEINPDGLGALYFDEAAMDDQAKKIFNQSDDWRENPTYIGRRGEELFGACKIAQCRDPG